MGEWRGERELEQSAWQRKTGELTEAERVWRQPGEPSKAGTVRSISFDLMEFIPNPPRMMAGLWRAGNFLFSNHHQLILKYNGPVLFLPFSLCFCTMGGTGRFT